MSFLPPPLPHPNLEEHYLRVKGITFMFSVRKISFSFLLLPHASGNVDAV